MKYTEFHRIIEKNGWKYSHAEGSHYFYIKDGRLSPPVPYHGAKELPASGGQRSGIRQCYHELRQRNRYINQS